ncbi:phospholipase D-like domain-containing protein [Halocatena halophila]|uniref:phospholipase D-like domain-containing protein n=1 Tax=Halocatena halophila TaxID=2814576 RepID=UPI002ED0C747
MSSDTTSSPDPEIVAIYPDPVAENDQGEFVELIVHSSTSSLVLRDDEGAVAVSNTTVQGRVQIALDSSKPPPTDGAQTVGTNGTLSLANTGERLELVADGRVVDVVTYENARSGERYINTDDGWEWRPRGATDLPVVESSSARATLYAFPGGTEPVARSLKSATDRILLAGYTFSDPQITTLLIEAHRRGVTVELLLDGGPVGGMLKRQARQLDRLVAAGVTVHMLGGEHARYRFHHAKYAVVDESAIILTENWKPAGVGSRSSRGWGTTIKDRQIAAGLTELFRADSSWNDSQSWSRYRRTASFEPSDPIGDRYDRTVDPQSVRPNRTRLLVGPENAAHTLRGALSNATTSIRVVQVSIGGPDGPFTTAAIAAARRGVSVRILLSSEWYVRDENRAMAAQLNRRANRSDLDLRVKLADPRGRFEKIHAKGVIIDSDTVMLGSLNWNQNAAQNNRELLVAMEGKTVGQYYTAIFDADWNGEDTHPLPVGALVVLVILTVIALWIARRISFEGRSE